MSGDVEVLAYFNYEGMHFGTFNAGVDEANARLIAAAPELLAALRAMCRESRKGKPDPDKLFNLAVDAIAKAEGRQP